ncbi:uncharacterized protein N7496_008875 [Penicillium cataractarum]|uniref:CFEM domain-containing protein n=1 Tax=Penicillium cataractarum TaxID=2100454 RepID=A0A9W9V7C1_9EURO|nr:uncharacterized protein N7496_008875 [Penicillium cataractarum]KAJ5369115.1 hypothetical protein N7496_008875 [Penicillium cataractarum]
MKLSIFLPLAAFLTMTAAEVAHINDDWSPCLNRCLSEGSAVAGCISQYDTACTCTSPAFRDAVQMCLELACTADDAAMALELHEERCGTPPS